MKGITIKSCLSAGAACFALTLGGCISLPNGPMSPNPRFYLLSATSGPPVIKKINITPGVFIGIGPVKIPEYLNRPQMVTNDKAGTLKFDEFDRWGESLDIGIARLIREDLTAMLPEAKLAVYPWNPSVTVRYQVAVEIVQLDSELDKGIFLAVQWMIIDLKNSKTVMIKRSEFRRPISPQDYAGLAQTLSAACASLSGQIAEALSSPSVIPRYN